jgi:hypothetical protein
MHRMRNTLHKLHAKLAHADHDSGIVMPQRAAIMETWNCMCRHEACKYAANPCTRGVSKCPSRTPNRLTECAKTCPTT